MPKVSEWLDTTLDSHGIYEAELLDGLDKCDGIEVYRMREKVEIHYDGRIKFLTLPNESQITKSIERRGLGGYFDPGNSLWFFVGHGIASDLAELIAGRTSTKHGRGSAFRDDVEIIREAGE